MVERPGPVAESVSMPEKDDAGEPAVRSLPESPAPPGGYRLVVAAGAAVGMSLLGDSLLYNLLPREAEQLGIPVAAVGVLLSANRWVRLASNSGVSRLYERLGPRIPFLTATVLALIATTVYGVGWGFAAFLVARLGWGVAWSALRQGGYQAVWAGSDTARGRLMGVFWGTVRLGGATSVLLGGYLRDRFGYQFALGAVACATALAFPLALAIRWPAMSPQRRTPETGGPGPRSWRGTFGFKARGWLLGSGFLHGVFDGAFISTLSLFLAGRLGSDQPLSALTATVAGALLAVRWLAGPAIGPTLGALSDRSGQPRMVVLLTAVLLSGVAGTVGLAGLWPILFASLVFAAGAGLSVTLSAAASGMAIRSDRPHRFVGVYTTAADAGLAAGPLLAYSRSSADSLGMLYLAAAAMLMTVVLLYWRSSSCGEVISGKNWTGSA